MNEPKEAPEKVELLPCPFCDAVSTEMVGELHKFVHLDWCPIPATTHNTNHVHKDGVSAWNARTSPAPEGVEEAAKEIWSQQRHFASLPFDSDRDAYALSKIEAIIRRHVTPVSVRKTLADAVEIADTVHNDNDLNDGGYFEAGFIAAKTRILDALIEARDSEPASASVGIAPELEAEIATIEARVADGYEEESESGENVVKAALAMLKDARRLLTIIRNLTGKGDGNG